MWTFSGLCSECKQREFGGLLNIAAVVMGKGRHNMQRAISRLQTNQRNQSQTREQVSFLTCTYANRDLKQNVQADFVQFYVN